MADIHEGLESALILLRTQMSDDITIARNYADLEPIFCSPDQLNQVFMHVLKNAIQAIQGKGEIRIGTWRDDDAVTVQIGDTGVGIPPDQLDHIFDLDFHASNSRMKMGLGLSTDFNIVQRHGGKFEIKSDVGRGTDVTISLPIRKSPQDGRRAPTIGQAGPGPL